MPRLILLFNHTLTGQQAADGRAALGVDDIIEPPAAVRDIWARVPPDIDGLDEYLAPVFAWLEETADSGDFVLVQGEFGATWLAVNRCFALGLVPVYSTTRRQAREEHLDNGRVEMRHLFSHVRFRRYGD